ncbi:nucleic acid/nucleotide deaminase domain-containing protein [Actinocatenispora thailandica]|uniref:nucleic acid/nucleotide deaminase domain-containing protein n=1 Tax=Actinocatenispora thailandica TaxID=227318 RepID=UPI003B8363DD
MGTANILPARPAASQIRCQPNPGQSPARYLDENGEAQTIVARSSKGRGNHAENKILRMVDPAPITDLYSELQPCARLCAKALGQNPHINVTWSWAWTTSAAGGGGIASGAIRGS